MHLLSVGGPVIGRVEAYCEASFAAVRVELNRDCSNSDRTRPAADRPARRALTITTSEFPCGVRWNASETTSTRGITTPERSVSVVPSSSCSETDAWGIRTTVSRTTLGPSRRGKPTRVVSADDGLGDHAGHGRQTDVPDGVISVECIREEIPRVHE